MPEIIITEDLLSPEDKITTNFTGQNPLRICQNMKLLFEKVMQVEGKDTFERVFKWDMLEEPRSFFNLWTALREEDLWTKIIGKAVLQGKQNSKTKAGTIKIEISGYLETKFEYSNFLQKAFWLAYNYMFYWKRRRQYMERGREYLFTMMNEITRELKIPKE